MFFTFLYSYKFIEYECKSEKLLNGKKNLRNVHDMSLRLIIVPLTQQMLRDITSLFLRNKLLSVRFRDRTGDFMY